MIAFQHGTVNGYNNRGCKCADCRRAWNAYNAPRMKAYRAKHRVERLCVECVAPVAPPSRSRCARHLALAQARQLKYGRRVDMAPEARDRERARWRAVVAAHVAAGLCCRCHEPIAPGSKSRCAAHLAQARAWKQRRRAERGQQGSLAHA